MGALEKGNAITDLFIGSKCTLILADHFVLRRINHCGSEDLMIPTESSGSRLPDEAIKTPTLTPVNFACPRLGIEVGAFFYACCTSIALHLKCIIPSFGRCHVPCVRACATSPIRRVGRAGGSNKTASISRRSQRDVCCSPSQPVLYCICARACTHYCNLSLQLPAYVTCKYATRIFFTS